MYAGFAGSPCRPGPSIRKPSFFDTPQSKSSNIYDATVRLRLTPVVSQMHNQWHRLGPGQQRLLQKRRDLYAYSTANLATQLYTAPGGKQRDPLRSRQIHTPLSPRMSTLAAETRLGLRTASQWKLTPLHFLSGSGAYSRPDHHIKDSTQRSVYYTPTAAPQHRIDALLSSDSSGKIRDAQAIASPRLLRKAPWDRHLHIAPGPLQRPSTRRELCKRRTGSTVSSR